MSKRYVTISVLEDVKRILEKGKGSEDWSSFLLKIYREYEYLRRLESFRKLRSLLSDEDLREIEESIKEFREKFSLR
ncbi:MAG: antitoxin VapB family protein [archaeon GB-1867-035]|nr:antitoxin VapB family protein [Candidatus Culexmicrobium profundum]